MGAGTIYASKLGWTQMYWQPAERGWAWFWGSVACGIVLHDTYFYWTHRMMHHRWLYPWFHRVHHQSTNPTPWAAYAFAPARRQYALQSCKPPIFTSTASAIAAIAAMAIAAALATSV